MKKEKMIELKSPNPSGYDTKYIINFHKPDVSVQQTEYSDVLKRLNEKLAVGSISKETYDEAVTAVYRRFPALTENLSDLQEISKSENKDTLPELLSEGIEKINEISVNTENTENIENIENIENKEPESVESLVFRARVSELCERIARKIREAAEEDFFYREKKSLTTVLEQELSENSCSSVHNVFRVLMYIEKISTEKFSVQEKVAFVKKINENVNYSCDEKILALNNVLKSDSKTPFLNADTRKHIINKIKLLNKVKASDFVFVPLERNKGKRKSETEKTPSRSYLPDDRKTDSDKKKIQVLSSSLDKYKKVQKKIISIAKNENISAEEKVSRILHTEISDTSDTKDTKDNKNSVNNEKIENVNSDSVTKSIVMSDKYFKFGAGTIVCLENMTMLVPSLFCFGSTDSSGRTSICCTGSIQSNSYDSESMEKIAPLVIVITRKSVKPEYRLHNFFNDGISECRNKNIRYRQTAADGFPAVYKHRKGDNLYSVSVYMPVFSCIVNIDFKFNAELINKSSTVQRILSELRFDRKPDK